MRAIRGGHAWLADSSGVDLTFEATLGGRTVSCGDRLDASPADLVDVGLSASGVAGAIEFSEADREAALARLADWFDRWIVAGLGVKGLSGVTDIFGRSLRMVQTGNLQTYAFLFVLGVAVVLLIFL